MDERHRMHEEHEKARKEKHSEWHRKKDEELRRRLLKVYGNGSEINYGECSPNKLHALNFFTYFCECIKPFSVQNSLCQLEYFFYLFLLKIIV